MTNSKLKFGIIAISLFLLICGVTFWKGCAEGNHVNDSLSETKMERLSDEKAKEFDTVFPHNSTDSEGEAKEPTADEISERLSGSQFEKSEKLSDNDDNVKIVIEDDAIFRRVDIMGKYISVYCGKSLFDALRGKTISSKLINELLAKPNEADAKAGKIGASINDYPFYIEPQLIVDKNSVEAELQRVGVLNSAKNDTGRKGDVTVTIRFSTCHQVVLDILHAEIRKDIPGANVQVMPYKYVQLMLRNGKETFETELVEGDLTQFEITFTAPGEAILLALKEGSIAARYYIPASYYKRNLSVSTVEILGKHWDAVDEAIRQRDSAHASKSNVYTGVGLQAVIKAVPIKFGFGSTDKRTDTKYDKWILKQHLQTICKELSANAEQYGYTEFKGATPSEMELPNLSQLLNDCFPEEKQITVKFDPQGGFSYTPNDPNFVAVVKEELKEELANNGIRDEKIVDETPMKVQLGIDAQNSIARLTQNLTYTFHHVTDASIEKAVNIRKTRVDFQPLVAQRNVGPVIVSAVLPAKTRDEIISFGSQEIKGSVELLGGDYAMSRAKEGVESNKFLRTSSNSCLAQGATVFQLEGETRHIEENGKDELVMQIRCCIKDDDTNYLWSKDIVKDFSRKPEEKVLGIVVGNEVSASLQPSFFAERTESEYDHGIKGTKPFTMLGSGGINNFFFKADVVGDYHAMIKGPVKCNHFFSLFHDAYHWRDVNRDQTSYNIGLSISPQVKIRIQTKPQEFVFGRPQPSFKFVFEDGKFQPVK